MTSLAKNSELRGVFDRSGRDWTFYIILEIGHGLPKIAIFRLGLDCPAAKVQVWPDVSILGQTVSDLGGGELVSG